MATDDLGADRPRRAPRTGSVPALYLSMIAVDRSWQGKGLGSDLAIDALGRARDVAGEVGLKLVVLDVIEDGGDEVFARRMEFYRRLGFQSFQDRPERMFIAIDTIRAMFDCR
ncbi:MAG: GNAT family N-acetyltransferase [Albidovulum sp.]|nr:GNAT family N-acetyltransferase [Albidovulum sp.]